MVPMVLAITCILRIYSKVKVYETGGPIWAWNTSLKRTQVFFWIVCGFFYVWTCTGYLHHYCLLQQCKVHALPLWSITSAAIFLSLQLSLMASLGWRDTTMCTKVTYSCHLYTSQLVYISVSLLFLRNWYKERKRRKRRKKKILLQYWP